MKTHPFVPLFVAAAFATLLLAGCGTPAPAPLLGKPDLLEFLTDSKTTREDVLLNLGTPSGKFEQEKILTYQLGFDPRNKGYILVNRSAGYSPAGDNRMVRPFWFGVRYSLTLVFDEQGVLRRHSLVEVNK
jgi:hypothetical protein